MLLLFLPAEFVVLVAGNNVILRPGLKIFKTDFLFLIFVRLQIVLSARYSFPGCGGRGINSRCVWKLDFVHSNAGHHVEKRTSV